MTTMLTLLALTASFAADGEVDAAEVETLRDRFYADGTIDQDEAAVIFDLNDQCDSFCDEWTDFAAQTIYDYAAADGTIGIWEATFIRTRIEGDGVVDDTEKAILNRLLDSGATMPPSFALWARTQVA